MNVQLDLVYSFSSWLARKVCLWSTNNMYKEILGREKKVYASLSDFNSLLDLVENEDEISNNSNLKQLFSP